MQVRAQDPNEVDVTPAPTTPTVESATPAPTTSTDESVTPAPTTADVDGNDKKQSFSAPTSTPSLCDS
ncbi:hypothetical protein PF005_g16148 [Phytophthora fragariae]|uniref:Uncharacterized protein n=1 Tax=Phytophthora fragariae TaxID=53985 RepID=A0A6A3XFV6_9STRA|nr:hypothetical protein PF009_g16910 [Phytophthora fragariae]KAE8997900.1 hypothetical protein PF011_g15278 [Phytophthora fragariae]KAE9096349.1 hypothetical protein PF010_g16373 [Phytophthora fragariae]KAE9097876.1 hypothetical protein PF007_g16460 [Phytophthora fragariae]KAE9141540.1 hypothetical protein PF006_g13164 [Phytophthora fragariae]